MDSQCPECGAPVALPEDVFVDEIVDCDECGAEIRVVSLNPVVVESFEEEEK